MLDDLDTTLKAILDAAEAPPELRDASVEFETPDRDYRPTGPTVNLFLLEVEENRELRDPTRRLVAAPNGLRSEPPLVRVDCRYVVTAWADLNASRRVAEEHHLLALALGWLALSNVVDEAFLVGSLKTPPQPYPVGISVGQRREDRAGATFWSALGVAPRSSFALSVTLTLPPFAPSMPEVEVADVRVLTGLSSHPRLTGRVLTDKLLPVAAATVAEPASGEQATTAVDGTFTLPGLTFGTYTLRVSRPNRPDTDQDVIYKPQRQIHHLIVPSP